MYRWYGCGGSIALRCVALIIACCSLVHGCPLPFEVCLEHNGEKSCHCLESFDKLLAKSTETNKMSKFMSGGQSRPTSDDLDLLRVRVYSVLINDVSAKSKSWLQERRVLDAGKQLVSL